MTWAPPKGETRTIQLGVGCGTAVSYTPHRPTMEEHLLAGEVRAIGKRVELLDGELWDVGIGPWHGDVSRLVGT